MRNETLKQPAERGDRSRHVALALLILVYTLNFLDRQILSILKEPIAADLHLSDTDLGLLGGFAFALFYSVLAIPAAWLADRFSRVWIITAGLFLWSLFTALCGMATGFAVLFVARMGVGVGEAGGVAPAYSLIADYFPPRAQARALAIYSFGIPIGSAAGVLFGGLVANAIDWRFAFLAIGAFGVLLAPLFRLLVRDPPRQAAAAAPQSGNLCASVASEGSSCVAGAQEPEHTQKYVRIPSTAGARNAERSSLRGGSLGLAAVARLAAGKPTFWLLAFGCGCSSLVAYGLMYWLPTFLARTLHMDIVARSQLLAAVLFFGGIAGMGAGGWLGDKLGSRGKRAYALIPAVAFLLSAPLYALAILARTPLETFLLLLLPYALALVWLGPVLTAVQHLAPAGSRSTMSALFLLVNNLIGLGLGPYFFGRLSDALMPTYAADSIKYAFLFGLGFYLVAAVLLYFASRRIARDWVE